MKYVRGLRCVRCGRSYSTRTAYTCPRCGPNGILDVEYDYPAIAPRPDAAPSGRESGTVPLALPSPASHRRGFSASRACRGMDAADPGARPGALHRRRHALSERRRTQRHGLAERPRQLHRRSEGAREAAQDHRLREHRKCRLLLRRHGGFHGVAERDLRTATRARAEGHATADFRRHRLRVRGSYEQAFQLCQRSCEQWGWYNRNSGINPYLVEGRRPPVWRSPNSLPGSPPIGSPCRWATGAPSPESGKPSASSRFWD